MASSSAQKLKVLHLMDILKTETDLNCTPELGLGNEGPSSGGAVCFEETRFGNARESCEADRAGVWEGLAGVCPCNLGGRC